jgi:ABC-type glycerol-3-phosphate transport system substrate-binding protein
MKKQIAFITAMTMCLSAFSCSGKKSGSSKPDSYTDYTAGELTDIGYKKSSVTPPEELSMLYSCLPYGSDGKQLLLGAGTKDTLEFLVTDREFSTCDEINIPDFLYLGRYEICTAADGTIVEFDCEADYGGVVDPYTEPNFNAEDYKQYAEYSFIIRAFSPDGKMTVNVTAEDFPAQAQVYTNVTDLSTDGKLLIAKVDGKYEVVNMEGKYLGSPKTANGEVIKSTGNNSSGDIICIVENDSGVQLRKLNEDLTLEESSVTYESLKYISDKVVPGYDGYSCFIRSSSTIYGVKEEDSSLVPLFGINIANINTEKLAGFTMCSDGTFNVATRSYSDWTWNIKKYTQTEAVDEDSIPRLKLATFSKQMFGMDYVEAFNDQCSDFQIDVVCYYDTTSSGSYSYDERSKANEDAKTKLRNDIVKGDLPDIFVMYPSSGVNFGDVNMAKAGALYDLYEFIDKDDELNRDTLMPQILKISESYSPGKVYTISNYFSAYAPYTCLSKTAEGIDKWDISAYLDILEKKDSDTYVWGNTSYGKDYVEYDQTRLGYINLACWLDFDKAKCYFDTPEFVRFLKYCAKGEKYDESKYSSQPAELSPEELNRLSHESQTSLMTGKALFSHVGIHDYAMYLQQMRGQFNSQPITTLGNLTYDGSGSKYTLQFDQNCFGISSTSEHKDYAWEFIKYMFSDDYYNSTKFNKGVQISGFPGTKKAVEKLKAHDKEPIQHDPEWLTGIGDYTGIIYQTGPVYNEETQNWDNTFVKAGYVTDEVIAEVDKILDSATALTNQDSGGKLGIPDEANDIYWMFQEETDKFFAGEYTAEHCAEVLQSRISIFMSEQFG